MLLARGRTLGVRWTEIVVSGLDLFRDVSIGAAAFDFP